MSNKLPLEERSISQIYMTGSESVRYTIPIYQRNYAWGEDQIEALVSDIHNAFAKSASSVYYIGTLVTYHRGDRDYEVIDGQQRLTTIYLILKALGIDPINTLTYTARRISAQTLQHLPDFKEECDRAIERGFKEVREALKSIVGDPVCEPFKQYFLHNVHLIHYRVPKDIDLNHYFEVMNSRGEQLEMHEIVKSMLSEPLADKEEMALFNEVWSACSEMNLYIQQRLNNPTIFGHHLDNFCIGSYEQIHKPDDVTLKASIRELMNYPIVSADVTDASEQHDRFQPIIDFPNFLMIVLKLTLIRQGRSTLFDALDDKELLRAFERVWEHLSEKEERAAVAREYLFNLLKARYLLDNYIIHHDLSVVEQEGSNPWKLEYFYHESSTKCYPKNLASDLVVQLEMVHLLSLFEVTFTQKQRKNYLLYCLLYLFDNFNCANYEGRYLDFLRKLADKYFFDIYLNANALSGNNNPKPNAFDEAILHNGTLCLEVSNHADQSTFNAIYTAGSRAIPLFVFNYTDYLLWRKYAQTLRGRDAKYERTRFFEELGCSDFGLGAFDSFYFSRTRKSLEHYYPQAKAIDGEEDSGEALCVRTINSFGNFAMISSEANSSGSNWAPVTKLTHYLDRKSDPVGVASLKFRVMMQRCRDNQLAQTRANEMEWDGSDIATHQAKMLDILFGTINP